MAARKPIRTSTQRIANQQKTPKEPRNEPSFFEQTKVFLTDTRLRFIVGSFLLGVAGYVCLSLISYFFTGKADFQEATPEKISNWMGFRGAKIANFAINKCFGVSVFCIVAFVMVLGLRLTFVRICVWKAFLHLAFWTVWLSVLLGTTVDRWFGNLFFLFGGQHGTWIYNLLHNEVKDIGIALILAFSLISYFVVANKKTIPFILSLFTRKTAKQRTASLQNEEDQQQSVRIGDDIVPEEWVNTDSDNNDDDFEIVLGGEEAENEVSFEISSAMNSNLIENQIDTEILQSEPKFEIAKTEGDEEGYDSSYNLEKLGKYDPTLDLSHYAKPPLNLLKVYDSDSESPIDMSEQKANKDKITNTLRNYGIEIESIKATVGPTITLYEIVPKAGVRISKIRNLESDIMLSLAATGIRIIAPIPGKGTIGIEVPNASPQIVSMHSVISAKKFQESTYELPVVFGKTITNEVFMVDLTKMPHLLVAGATGQGKSVGLNAIITSLLYKKHPSELKLVLVDPKKVEFNIYGDIEKHFLAKMPDGEEAIITDTSKVVQTLNSLCKEMDDRYDLLKKAHTRNLKEYNEKFVNRQLNPEKGHRYLPYIVVIVDEFGDLIMTAGKEVEMPIARIAQLARAVGIHMIIATQRPSVNIITGIIKANFPARVAFRVSSMMDSRTILDAPGANQLVGRGDLLFSQGNDLTRVQCAFVDTPEVEKIVHYIYGQQGYSTAFYLPEYVGGDGETVAAENVDMSKRDPLFSEAARVIVASQQGSTSLIQRKFSIGYNRAGKIVDQLEVAGIIGPFEGSKARQVLVQDEYSLEQILRTLP